MKPKLVAFLASAVALLAVLAGHPHPAALEAVAESRPYPAVAPTATAEAEREVCPESAADRRELTPVDEVRPSLREEVKAPRDLRPGGAANAASPQAPQVALRPCPGASLVDPQYYQRLHQGRCPPATRSNTPLVLSFDGAPIEYRADRTHGFDVDGTASAVTDWPTARSPWLALDRDGDGRIADGSELFGSMTVLSGGERAPDGFAALRELDADGDGHITPADPGFAQLLVWTDADGDRRATPDELAPASAYELLSIDLDYSVDPRCDARGNCEVERASFRYRDDAGVVRTGAVVDVHLAVQR